MNGKKLTIVLILIVILSALAACGSSDTAETTTAGTSALSANYDEALPTRTQLIVGMLQLEGTDQQVSLEQARDLLPLWQGSRALQRTGSESQEEVTAVLNQIEDALTAEQIETIQQMQLTRQDLQDTAKAFGLAVGTGEGAGTGPGATGKRGQGNGQPQRSGPNTSEMLLEQLLTVLEGRLQ